MKSDDSVLIPSVIRAFLTTDRSKHSFGSLMVVEHFAGVLSAFMSEAAEVQDGFISRNRQAYDEVFRYTTDWQLIGLEALAENPTIDFDTQVSQHDFDGEMRLGAVMNSYTNRHLLRLIELYQGRWCAELMALKLQVDNENIHLDLIDYFELCCLNLFRWNYGLFESFEYVGAETKPSFASTTYQLYKLARHCRYELNSSGESHSITLIHACMSYHQMASLMNERTTLYKHTKTSADGEAASGSSHIKPEDRQKAMKVASDFLEMQRVRGQRLSVNSAAKHVKKTIVQSNGDQFSERSVTRWINEAGIAKLES